MLNSTILDVVLAIVFLFLGVSLAAGAAVEAGASFFNLRSTTLLAGLKDLLNDPDFNDLAAELYAHALISPRGPGLSGLAAPPPPPAGAAPLSAVRAILNAPQTAPNANSQKNRLEKNLAKNRPAYIDPKQFAAALTDILALVPSPGTIPTIQELQNAVNHRLPPEHYPQLNQLLLGIIARTGGDMKNLKAELCNWFNNAMDRVSGVYKKYTQLLTFLAALAISILINADTIGMAQRVWSQPTRLAALTVLVNGKTTMQGNTAFAESLPFGWSGNAFWSVPDQDGNPVTLAGRPLLTAALGWLITAFAALFGAPFWFDALQRIARLKGAGPSPAEKSDHEAAAA